MGADYPVTAANLGVSAGLGRANFGIWLREGRAQDTNFTAAFDAVFVAAGMRIIKTPVQAPGANAFAGRRVSSARRECPDRMLIVGERYLRLVLDQYIDHYRTHRPHRALPQSPSAGRADPLRLRANARVLAARSRCGWTSTADALTAIARGGADPLATSDRGGVGGFDPGVCGCRRVRRAARRDRPSQAGGEDERDRRDRRRVIAGRSRPAAGGVGRQHRRLLGLHDDDELRDPDPDTFR